MATPRKVGKRWRIELTVKGQKFSAYRDTKQEAINWAIETQAANSDGLFIRGRTVQMLFDRYTDEVTVHKKGERWERIRLKKLAKKLGHMQAHGISRRDIEVWRDEALKKIAPSSVNRELNTLSAVFSQGIEWRWLQTNPVTGVKRPRNPKHRERIISDGERDKLCEALGVDRLDPKPPQTRLQQLGLIMLLALETAMRLGEIIGLRWENINLEHQYLTLLDSKNGESRDVPLSLAAVSYLKATRPKTEGRVFNISRDVASNYFRDARRSVDIECTFHDTRHTAITRMANSLTPMQLARAVGHKDLNMTLKYFNESASELAKRLS